LARRLLRDPAVLVVAQDELGVALRRRPVPAAAGRCDQDAVTAPQADVRELRRADRPEDGAERTELVLARAPDQQLRALAGAAALDSPRLALHALVQRRHRHLVGQHLHLAQDAEAAAGPAGAAAVRSQ